MDYRAKSQKLKCCVIIPTYNNDGTLREVISSVLEFSSDVIVLDDGCTDGSAEILNSFVDQIVLLRHNKNLGKGKSLRDAFEYAWAKGYYYAITIDSDGQHFASDLPLFLNQIETHPGAIVIGARNMTHANVPGKSSFGHKFSNFWFRFETGIKLDDTQSGYRLYPIYRMQELHFRTNKFEFEIEVIVKAAWKGIPVKNVPIQIYYAPGDERVSHFRPFRDFTRVSLINTWFVILALAWYIPLRLVKMLTRENISAFFEKQIFNKDEPISRKANSIGFGVFMGIFPIWGYQMLVGLLLAQAFKLNKALVLLAANISFPPFIPFIVYASYSLGARFFSEPKYDLDFSREIDMEWVGENILQYAVGALVLAVIAGVFSGVASYIAIWFYRRADQ